MLSFPQISVLTTVFSSLTSPLLTSVPLFQFLFLYLLNFCVSLVEFSVKVLQWSDKERVRLQLWDIAGTNTFDSRWADRGSPCSDGWTTLWTLSSFQVRSVSFPWPGSTIKARWAASWCLTSPAHPVSAAVATGNRTWTTKPCCPTESPSPASCWPTRWFSAITATNESFISTAFWLSINKCSSVLLPDELTLQPQLLSVVLKVTVFLWML